MPPKAVEKVGWGNDVGHEEPTKRLLFTKSSIDPNPCFKKAIAQRLGRGTTGDATARHHLQRVDDLPRAAGNDVDPGIAGV